MPERRPLIALLLAFALLLASCSREKKGPSATETQSPETPRNQGTEEPRNQGTEEPRNQGTEEPRTQAPEEPRTQAPEAPRKVDWTSEVRLVPVSYEEWESELASFRGEIVVVDYWATWCVPCLERFPKMIQMSKTYGPKGAHFVSMSLDDRDDADSIPHVLEFLEKNDARIPNYLMDEIIPDAFEKLDLLGIPAVFVYDRRGRLRYRLTGDDPNDQFTEADVEEAVRKLLEET